MEDIISTITPLISAAEFTAAADAFENAELQEPTLFQTGTWPHTLHLLCLVHSSRLEDARFMYKRIPDHAKSDAELQAAFRLLQRLWVKDYEKTWEALNRPWQSDLQPIIDAISLNYRNRILKLVEKAYIDIYVHKLATLLGLSEEETLRVVQGLGWEATDNNKLIVVKPSPPEAEAEVSLESVQKLASYIVSLER